MSFESMIVLSFDFIVPTCTLLSDAAVVLVRGATDSTFEILTKRLRLVEHQTLNCILNRKYSAILNSLY